MPADQGHDVLPIPFSHPKPGTDLLRHIAADSGVPVKMTLAPGIYCKGIYLSNVMQQHGPAQDRLRPDGIYGISRVRINIIAMMNVLLRKADARQQLRNKNSQHIRIIQQHFLAALTAQKLVHFHQDALGGNPFQ